MEATTRWRRVAIAGVLLVVLAAPSSAISPAVLNGPLASGGSPRASGCLNWGWHPRGLRKVSQRFSRHWGEDFRIRASYSVVHRCFPCPRGLAPLLVSGSLFIALWTRIDPSQAHLTWGAGGARNAGAPTAAGRGR